jgi:polysaccharide biosynthesis transport protein
MIVNQSDRPNMNNQLDLNSERIYRIEEDSRPDDTELKKYGLVLKSRWWIILLPFLIGTSFAGLYIRQKPQIYQGVGKILVRSDQSSRLIGFDSRSGEITGLTQKSDPLSTEAEILKSQPILKIASEALKLRDSQNKPITANVLMKKLIVKPVPGTDILQVTYKSESSKNAATVVNRVIQEYIRNNIEVNRSQAVLARKFILTELPQSEAKLRQAESALRRFREVNGVVFLEREMNASVESMSLLKQQINSTEALFSQSNAKALQLQKQVGMDVDEAIVVNALNQSSSVQNSFVNWRQAQAELERKRAVYKEGTAEINIHLEQVRVAQEILKKQVYEISGGRIAPSIDKLQLSKTQQDLVSELARAETEKISLYKGLKSLQKSHESLVLRARLMPALESSQRELQRQVDVAQTTYKTLLTKLQEMQVAENQSIGNVRVVSYAIEPEEPDNSKTGLILLGAGVIGLSLGVSLAFLIDSADRSVKTTEEITSLMNYSVLGMIPFIQATPRDRHSDEIPQLITQDFPHFGGQEAYQMLQANLRFLPVDKVARSIVVTSATPKEGKSTVAANLALALAQGQRRVLLVDADMRRGCQHHVWGLTHGFGLSNVLVGQAELEQATVAVRSNLHVLQSGTVPPNPLTLLDSTAMSALVDQFMEHYDFVIFDSPTLTGTADGTVLNRLVDGSLLVTRLGQVETEHLKTMRQFLMQSGHQVLGLVVNGVKDTHSHREFPCSTPKEDQKQPRLSEARNL